MRMRRRQILDLCCLVLSLAWMTASSSAQESVRPEVRFTRSDGAPGVRLFTPDRWSTVGVTIINPTNQGVELLSAHYFPGNPDLQFARQLWIPAHARRITWYPIRPVPSKVPQGNIPVQALLIDRSTHREVVLREPTGRMSHPGLLPSEKEKGPAIGLISDEDDPEPRRPMINAALTSCQFPTRVFKLSTDHSSPADNDSFLPTMESLQVLDTLIVASDRPVHDPAELRAIRLWLHNGGNLWIMLDRVSLSTAALLLGEDLPWTETMKNELSQWQMHQDSKAQGPEEESGPTREPVRPGGRPTGPYKGQIGLFDPPVEMTVLDAAGVKSAFSIDQVPAAFWRRAGQGQVLFTTLGPRGWILPAGKSPSPPGKPPDIPPAATEPLHTLARHVFRITPRTALASHDFAPFVSEQIGYRIIDRGSVLAVLGSYCLILTAAAVWLARRQRLPQLAWIGPMTGVAAALTLVVMGLWHRQAVPATAAEGQLVEVAQGGQDAQVSGILGIYNQTTSSAELGASRGGTFFPDQNVQAGQTRRMVWTDFDRWHWENLSLSAGLHLMEFKAAVDLDRPISARATLGSDGLHGKISLGSLSEPSDAILALPSQRRLAIRFLDGDGTFASGPGDQLAPGQFLNSAVMSDTQRRRQDLYHRLLDQHNPTRYPNRPMILTWASPVDLGFTVAEGARQTGSALVAIPLTLERPAPGTAVLLPAPLVRYQGVPMGSGDGMLVYDGKKNEWLSPVLTAGKTRLRFQVPSELLPLHIERATLTVDIHAQGRSFEVFGGKEQATEVLAKRQSPVGTLRIEVDRPDLLQPDATGGIYLVIAVGEGQKLSSEKDLSDGWKITNLQLELAGRIPGP
jgi:hypothetical protein